MKTRKTLQSVDIPEFQQSIDNMEPSSMIYVDKVSAIAHRIHTLLEKKGLTQRELANKMFKNEEEISKWINGEQNFTLRTIAKIEAALGEPLIIVL